MKIFGTRCKDTVTECSYYFGLQSIADLIKKRKLSFLLKIVSSPNSICQLFVSVALCETKLLKTQRVHTGPSLFVFCISRFILLVFRFQSFDATVYTVNKVVHNGSNIYIYSNNATKKLS